MAAVYPKITDAAFVMVLVAVALIVMVAVGYATKKKAGSPSAAIAGCGAAAGLLIVAGFIYVLLPGIIKTQDVDYYHLAALFGGGMMVYLFSFLTAKMLSDYARGTYQQNIKHDELTLGLVHQWNGGRSINPQYFTVSQKALYTNIHVVGGIGSGKTTTVVYPTLQQILMDTRPEHKPAVFLIDVKGGVIDDVKNWNHPRKNDLVVLGYGHQKVNIIGGDDPLIIANNLNVGFAGFKGDKVDPFYKNYQETYLRNTLSILFSFVKRDRKNDIILTESVNTDGDKKKKKGDDNEPSDKEKRLKKLINSPFFQQDTITLNEVFNFIVSEDWRRSIMGYYYELKGRQVPLGPIIEQLLSYFMSTKDDQASYLSGLVSDLNTLMTDKIKDYFCDTKSFDFQAAIDKGQVVLVNVPEGQFGNISKLIGLQFLLQYQRAVLKRMDPAVTINRSRTCIIILDEVQKFMCAELANFTSVSRQAKACTIALHQDLGQIPEEYQASFLANIRTKIILNVNDYYTADYFSKFFGEHITKRLTYSQGRGGGGGGGGDFFQMGSSHSSKTQADQREPRFYPQDIIGLKKNRAIISYYTGDQVEESRSIDLLPYYEKRYNLFP